MTLAAVIVSPILTPILPISGKGRQNIIYTLTSDYWAEVAVKITLIVVGGAATFIVNLVRVPVQMDRESSQTIQRPSDELATDREYIDQLLINPRHIHTLKEVLRQVGSGPPAESRSRNLLYDQLREHLADSTIWAEADRYRQLVADASDGRAAAQQKTEGRASA